MEGAHAEIFKALASDRGLLGRRSTAERVADILRRRITDGVLRPGTRLSEDAIGAALSVSRNTLREAFRLLLRERLVVHELNRGVFVRQLEEADVVDLYRVRQLVECAAVRCAGTGPEPDLAALRRAVEAGEAAAAERRWHDVATANIDFHRALVALAGSERLDDYMRQVFAELRLVFHVMHDPRTFHAPYLGLNRTILELIEIRDVAAAESNLADYLSRAERQLLETYAETSGAA